MITLPIPAIEARSAQEIWVQAVNEYRDTATKRFATQAEIVERFGPKHDPKLGACMETLILRRITGTRSAKAEAA